MNGYKMSDQVRAVARDRYVVPALRAGNTELSIRVRNVLDDLIPLGFPATNTPQVCSALQSGKFLKDNGLIITSVDGPPSKKSTTVVVHYRIASGRKGDRKLDGYSAKPVEDNDARAKRITESLRGLLREEMKKQGGAESFIKWVRSDEEGS